MSMRRYIGMMAALLGASMTHNRVNALEFKKGPDISTPVPFNLSAQWHPQARRITGGAKQRRASAKARNINRQKRHPNYRSAS